MVLIFDKVVVVLKECLRRYLLSVFDGKSDGPTFNFNTLLAIVNVSINSSLIALVLHLFQARTYEVVLSWLLSSLILLVAIVLPDLGLLLLLVTSFHVLGIFIFIILFVITQRWVFL